MMTLTHKRCPWKELVGNVVVVILMWKPAWAAEVAVHAGLENPLQGSSVEPAASPWQDEHLYLEVVLNRAQLRQVAHFVLRNGQLLADATTLFDLGLTWPGAASASGLVRLDDVPGLRQEYDVANQRLALVVPLSALDRPTTELGYRTPASPRLDPATQAPGLLLNYDLYGQKDQNSRSISGWTEFRMFGVGPGLWRTSNLMQSVGGSGGESTFTSTRLDTSWQLDFPDPMITVTMGDAFTSALSWTRTMRFGGLRVSRNFDLQPYRLTVPLASFAGETALPSVVDLYVNGIREAQSRVPPGQFQIVSTPVITGAGTAQMVITDITGQRRVVNFSIYSSAQLLQQGLGDWSLEVGKLRDDYGLRSFSYADEVMYSASVRYGLSNYVTLEAHGERSDALAMGGIGALFRLGQLGVINVSHASSNQDSRRGKQYGVGYQWQGQRFSVNMSTLHRDSSFRDIGTLQGSQLPLRTSQAFLGWSIGRGQLGASYVRQDYRDSPRASYVGLSWSQSLGKYGHVSIGGNRDLDGNGGTSAFFYWSLPLGGKVQAWTSIEHQNHGNTVTAGASRNLPGDADGWGWRTQASVGQEAGGQAEINQLSRYGEWRAGSQYWHNQGSPSNTTVYAGATGGLLLMKGSVFPMRRVYDSFAVVSTDGIANVPVKLENRLIGTTDDKGLLLVTPLNAWQENDVSIDPLVLPADVSVERVRMKAVPSTGSGMYARFPMKVTLAVELAIRHANGALILPGTEAKLSPGDQTLIVGYDGRVYMEDPPQGAQIIVLERGSRCVVDLPADLPQHGRFDLGELTCQ
ncbi:fimbria/pilus outer membrane usher protein [Bordetella pseudohinzii]|uniref:F1 capsule-anchoring protein n=1 Tax=Bordetella pseudohinzii TaxID=1331258 RepID=A0A0J6C9K2_9BORD|nr:fimbria/pilus outer membrane usher protein [Bordetella pseudohinzii]ANY16535.1 fimbrial assembly protein [Bordetella pseudohinzii]KMM27683.1 fimbrial assembly protein [Bordetella pseudohinzii]KXA81500.1 fimbrial assembly protein [Bordetella pseudohinzii]KXA82140.1 fimbrial assembly protein [Bordetella pseudohinzii]CUI33630.1 F1 capsule-anchoring protein precursor [Bordetella pseudohinzii]